MGRKKMVDATESVKFNKSARIRELHDTYPALAIAVDGGVGEANIAKLAQAGATRFGVGSAITKTPDPAAADEALLAMAKA